MSLQIIDTQEVTKIISIAKRERRGPDMDIQAKHVVRRKNYNQEEISVIIQSNKFLQVLLTTLLSNQIPKTHYEIACNVSTFIASDNMNTFQSVFNDICLFWNKKNRFIEFITLGEVDIQAKEVFNTLKSAGKLNSSIYTFFNWKHNYKLDDIYMTVHTEGKEFIFYELNTSNIDYWTTEEMENEISHNAVLQKLIVDTDNSGTGFLSIAGWSLKEISENTSFIHLKQLFEKVLFMGVIVENEWICINLIVALFSKQCIQYLNNDFFNRI